MVAFDYADDESGEIVLALGIKARHFSGLAADQGTAVMFAGFGEATDNFFGDFRVELAGSEIIHKKQWRGALYGDVVHTMVHQIAANGVVHVHLKGNL